MKKSELRKLIREEISNQSSKKSLQEILEPTLEYRREVEKIKNQGGKLVGSGDYGSVYELGSIVKKVTTDEIELEHASLLKGKQTKYFIPVIDVLIVNPKLGIITMPNMKERVYEIPTEIIPHLEEEARTLGIDPDELDISPDNFMKDASGKIKMVDV